MPGVNQGHSDALEHQELEETTSRRPPSGYVILSMDASFQGRDLWRVLSVLKDEINPNTELSSQDLVPSKGLTLRLLELRLAKL